MAEEAVTLDVGGMTCDGCAGRVRSALEGVSGVISAVVSHESSSAIVSHSGVPRGLMADAVRGSAIPWMALEKNSIGEMEVYGNSQHTTPSGA